MGVAPACMPRVSNAEVEVGGSSPFQEASLPLVLESRPMEPVDPAFSSLLRLAELEDPSVDVTAEIEDVPWWL